MNRSFCLVLPISADCSAIATHRRLCRALAAIPCSRTVCLLWSWQQTASTNRNVCCCDFHHLWNILFRMRPISSGTSFKTFDVFKHALYGRLQIRPTIKNVCHYVFYDGWCTLYNMQWVPLGTSFKTFNVLEAVVAHLVEDTPTTRTSADGGFHIHWKSLWDTVLLAVGTSFKTFKPTISPLLYCWRIACNATKFRWSWGSTRIYVIRHENEMFPCVRNIRKSPGFMGNTRFVGHCYNLRLWRKFYYLYTVIQGV